MADFEYVACPKCHDKFMAGEEFFRLPQAYCHCPYCGNEFPVGVAAGEAKAADKRAGRNVMTLLKIKSPSVPLCQRGKNFNASYVARSTTGSPL